jgi:dTDP-4-dehydrorhamnose reductase
MRVLILGASGMLGSAVFRQFDGGAQHEVWGLVRNGAMRGYFSKIQQSRLVEGVDVLDEAALAAAFSRIRPNVVINCVGLIKQQDRSDDPLVVLPINAMLPHRLASLCAPDNIRLLHISTDCVFSGRKGMYTEDDPSDAEDLYGKSKYIGELRDVRHAVTLRTSIIGRELNSNRALVDWFLTQQGAVHGFRRSIFSGMTTIELARIMRDVVLPDSSLHGLYHVSSEPISKFELLKLVAAQYGKAIDVLPDDKLVIDRSLDSSRFRRATGYEPPSWETMVRVMHEAEK